MAHPSPGKIPAPEPFSQRKTLFTAAPGKDAILVEFVKGKQRSRPLRFSDAHAALTWALDHGAGFVLIHGSDPAKN